MADHQSTQAKTDVYDGRFGEKFDDEISASSVVWTTIGLAVACALGMLITWGMQGYYQARSQTAEVSPIAAAVRQARASGATPRMPEGPLLQNDPESELEAMRHEMAERLSGYGWVDEGAGVAHIPIDAAIGMLVEQGSVSANSAAAASVSPEEGAE